MPNRKRFPFAGSIDFQGIQVNVENKKGSIRSGGKGDQAWSIRLPAHYGEISGQRGVDGDALDVFVGPDPDAKMVYVMTQKLPWTGELDENKVMCGYATRVEAEKAYRRAYDQPGFHYETLTWTIEEFKAWLADPTNRGIFVPHRPFKQTVAPELSKASGGPYIGPRGGKWADAAHTQPWKEGESRWRTFEGHRINPSAADIKETAARAHDQLRSPLVDWVYRDQDAAKARVFETYKNLDPIYRAALQFEVEDIVNADSNGSGWITVYRTMRGWPGKTPAKMGGASVATDPLRRKKPGTQAFRVHHSDILLHWQQGVQNNSALGGGISRSEQEIILRPEASRVEYLGATDPPLRKSRGYPPGTKRKWASGWREKQADGQWTPVVDPGQRSLFLRSVPAEPTLATVRGTAPGALLPVKQGEYRLPPVGLAMSEMVQEMQGKLSKAKQLDLFDRRVPEDRPANADRVITLNSGLGRDSTTMLILLAKGQLEVKGLGKLGLDDVDAVVFSDTGNEWKHTYDLIPKMRAIAGSKFVILEKPKSDEAKWSKEKNATRAADWAEIRERAASGYYHHRDALMTDMESRATVVSMSRGDCTEHHKISPTRRLIQDIAAVRFGAPSNRAWGVMVRKERREPHMTLIGITSDEKKRTEGKPAGPDYVTEGFPLIDMQITKDDENAILRAGGFEGTRKSGCYICPYQPVSWYWALRETDEQTFARIVGYEQTALQRNPRMTVKGVKVEGALLPLSVLVDRWREKNPDATVAAVLDKEYSRVKPETACKTASAAPEWPPRGGGWHPIPTGKKGGYRKLQKDGSYEYRYRPEKLVKACGYARGTCRLHAGKLYCKTDQGWREVEVES